MGRRWRTRAPGGRFVLRKLVWRRPARRRLSVNELDGAAPSYTNLRAAVATVAAAAAAAATHDDNSG